jgi:prepilin-type N-terminal cleavage/methylation domain-containing protein
MARKLIIYNLKLIKKLRILSSFALLSQNRNLQIINRKSLIVNHFSTQRAFTLIEYLVAITILAGLVGGIMFTLNPFTQVERSRDAQRRQDLQQVKNALETFYQDNSCYPQEIPFGEEWSVGSEIYMKEVPQDPSCGQLNGYCYSYITDSDSQCPQWNVAFARLSEVPLQSTTVCPLSTISDTCVPDGYDEHWACAMSGAVNCQLLAASGFGYDSGTAAEPTPSGPYVAPTPGPGSVTYTLGGGSGFNPYLRYLTLSPLAIATAGTAQTFIVTAEDATSDITSVKIHLFSDNASQVLTLNFAGGTPRNGTWAGTINADTYYNTYAMAIVGVNANGDDRCKVLTPGGEIEIDGEIVYFGGADARADDMCAQVNNN